MLIRKHKAEVTLLDFMSDSAIGLKTTQQKKAEIKRASHTNCPEDVEKLKDSHTAGKDIQ